MIGLSLSSAKLSKYLLGWVLATSVGAVCAALGQGPSVFLAASSAATPSAKKLAATPATQTLHYSTQETQLENGTGVVEYVSSEGVVFAVSWRGPVLPDLSTLLGDFFMTFKLETEQARLKGRRGSPVNIERNGLVISSNGRMRNFFGYAYAPALIPVGVNIKDVLQ